MREPGQFWARKRDSRGNYTSRFSENVVVAGTSYGNVSCFKNIYKKYIYKKININIKKRAFFAEENL